MRIAAQTLVVLAASAMVPACELFVSVPDYSIDTDPEVDGGTSDALDAPPAECETTAECTAAEVCVMGDCRPCDDDAHCGDPTANVCLPDGTCAALARIAYASPGGAGAACTLAAPCTLDQGLATAAGSATIDIVKLAPGAYPRASATTIAGDTVILAGQGATLTATTTIQMLRVTSGSLTIVGAELVGDQQFNALCIPDMAQPAALTLYRVVTRGGAYGIGGFSCALTIGRSTISGNTNIGLYAQGGTARISNTVVVGNGGAATDSTGLSFTNCPDAKVELTTITGNPSSGMSIAPGIDCTGSTVSVTSSIVWANPGPRALDAACTVDYSVVDPAYATGAHNVRTDPMLLGVGDYHLGAMSPARGIADPALTSPALDRDGERRPQTGSTFDVGADEVP